MLYPSYAQTKTTDISIILFVSGPNYVKFLEWLDRYNVKIETVDPTAPPDTQTGAHLTTITMVKMTHVLNATIQKRLLSEYNKKSKIKPQKG